MMDFADRIFIGSYVSDKKQRSGERAEEPALEDRHFPIRVLSRRVLFGTVETVYCCRSIAFVSLVKKPVLAL